MAQSCVESLSKVSHVILFRMPRTLASHCSTADVSRSGFHFRAWPGPPRPRPPPP
jgi:hypothetical protein